MTVWDISNMSEKVREEPAGCLMQEKFITIITGLGVWEQGIVLFLPVPVWGCIHMKSNLCGASRWLAGKPQALTWHVQLSWQGHDK